MASSVNTFNPAIDRHDERSAATIFQSLWPEPDVSQAIARNLAASIQAAHNAGESCWEVTMNPDSLRLNVGQVETLTLSSEGVRFLLSLPLEAVLDKEIEFSFSNQPVYRAVPVHSGVCFVRSDKIASLSPTIRHAHDAYIQAAASFKRVSPFRKSFSPAALEYIERVLGISLPRPGYFIDELTSQRASLLADEIDFNRPLPEGAKYQITINAYERNPIARRLCIARYGTACVICDFSFGAVYGKVAEGFIHVHHLRPLSEIGAEYEVDPVEDLRPVCPNCHAVLHQRTPAYSIEEVRGFLKTKQSPDLSPS
ncbi:HNH endonuclease [Zavarzinella formosa]|uniref:HNH endonuclease n=1 Tax=Zavarzinella formosa TaxID=360055 RepID=UPI00035FACC8|nr:HNH endonuclease [Zavarzinella formosa]